MPWERLIKLLKEYDQPDEAENKSRKNHLIVAALL